MTRPVGGVPQLARGGIRYGPTGLFYDDADGREVSYEDAVRAEAAEQTRAEPEDETRDEPEDATRDEEADETRDEPDEALVDETAPTATRRVSLLERALRLWTRGGNVARGVARAVSGAERLERERLCERVEALEDARVLVERERDALRDERDALRGERDALRDERDALRGERETLCAERDESRARNDEVRARNDELRVQSDEFRGFIDSVYHVVAGVQQSLKATADDE